MNEQELQAIEERANKASNAPWLIEAGVYSGSNWLVGTITVNLGESYRDDQVYFVTTKNVHASELEGDASTDADFIAHARADVPALIAEVRSLHAKLDAANVTWQEEHAACLVLAEQLKVAEAKAMFWWNEATHPNVGVQP